MVVLVDEGAITVRACRWKEAGGLPSADSWAAAFAQGVVPGTMITPLQASDAGSCGIVVRQAKGRPVIVCGVRFAIERPSEAVVNGHVAANLPRITDVPLIVMPVHLPSVDAVLGLVEQLGSPRHQKIGELVPVGLDRETCPSPR